jgi:hypothetical protein
MLWTDEFKTVIDSLENKEEASAYVKFLYTEIVRHEMDIGGAKEVIRQVREKWGIK